GQIKCDASLQGQQDCRFSCCLSSVIIFKCCCLEMKGKFYTSPEIYPKNQNIFEVLIRSEMVYDSFLCSLYIQVIAHTHTIFCFICWIGYFIHVWVWVDMFELSFIFLNVLPLAEDMT
ncbi:hypothetical protein ACJX0J_016369, partial [Zea mays]